LNRAASRLRAAAHRAADVLELPKDVLFSLPRVVVIGNMQVTVENHRGLLAYDGSRLVLAVGSGRLVVSGDGLVLGLVSAGEMTVTGRIDALQFETGAPSPSTPAAPPPPASAPVGPRTAPARGGG
jgi:sporulation protein YqfC